MRNFVRAGGPDAIAVFAIRAARTDIGFGGRPPGDYGLPVIPPFSVDAACRALPDKAGNPSSWRKPLTQSSPNPPVLSTSTALSGVMILSGPMACSYEI